MDLLSITDWVMRNFNSPSEVIGLWPKREAMACDLSRVGDPVTAARIHKWARSGSIPGRYWRRIVLASAAIGRPVTLDDLADMHDPVRAACATVAGRAA